jgi:hypothetical protein
MQEAQMGGLRSRRPGKKERPYLKNNQHSWALVTHGYNSTYSGGRDQDDQGWKPTSKKPITKKGLVEWLKV